MEYIVLIPNSIKKEVIRKARYKYYNYSIKFLSLEEFIKRYTFSYDNKTIYYLMKEFNLNLSSAMVYINNLYYINDRISLDKMNTLITMKKYLDNNNLLIYDTYFKDYVKDKEIYIYGYDYINKYYLSIFTNLNYKIIDYEYKCYDIKDIYEFDYIDNEVIFVIDKILSLIRNNISIDNIKLIISKEYEEVIDRLFKIYNIPINIKKRSIYSISCVKKVIANLDNIDTYIDLIIDNDIKDKLISVLNNYAFIEDKNEVKELIINDLKSTYLDNSTKGITISSLEDYFSDEDYVFLLGFNKENIPLYKDNDYFSDKEKDIMGYDTSNNLNLNKRIELVKKIKNIKNITISYKLYDANNTYLKSDLLEDINIINDYQSSYSNSPMMNKIFLSNMLDNLVKYNVMDKDINLLFSNYDIPYLEYDNSYKVIDKDKLYKYLDNKLLLSYTSLDNYYRCKFKYYLQHILRINIILDDFALLTGDICHYVLSCMDNKDFDIDKCFNDYIKTKREFTSKEIFFLDKVKNELIFIIDTIKKQNSYTTFDKSMKEKDIYISKDKDIKVTMNGKIDKVLYKEEDGITYIVVIDYKSGSANIDLKNMKYYLGMQLPIYLYLSNHIGLDNVKVVGFYLQKILSTNLDNSKDYITSKENSLKLEGYSTSLENILMKFDTTYEDSKLIKSMKITSKGFSPYSNVLSEEEITEMLSYVDDMIDKARDNILKGDFSIDPKVIEGKDVSCNFCEYKDICYKREKDKVYINREEDSNEV